MQRLSRAERVVQKLEQIALREGDTDGTQVRALELLGKTLGAVHRQGRDRGQDAA
jgi:hypothetical protein